MKKLIIVMMVAMTMAMTAVAQTKTKAADLPGHTTQVVNLNDLMMLQLLTDKDGSIEKQKFGLKKYYGNIEWSRDRTAHLATDDKEAKKLLNARFGTNFYKVVGDVDEWKFISSNNEQVIKEYDRLIRKQLLSKDYSEVHKDKDGLYYVRTVINGETVYQKAFK